MEELVVIGGGLAGSEAAFQAASLGVPVRLVEMRPGKQTEAHTSGDLAELVCSNSLGSKLPGRASGVLMDELRAMGSLLLEVAEANAVPAGGALAVDRVAFAREVTDRIATHPRIRLIQEEVRSIPQGGVVVLATGPLTSPALAEDLARLTGEDQLYFYDALSPIVENDSLDMRVAFWGSRYGRGELPEGDYLNCPLDERQYRAFVQALLEAERIPLRDFEAEIQSGVRAGRSAFFEGCLPVEVLAARGEQSLAYGPMRPVGLRDPRSGRRPHAVVQLRRDDLHGQLLNMVGFQTNLTYAEQRRVLRMIPGMEGARFVRYGQMHRNTFVNAPSLLQATLELRRRAGLFLAGQLTGVEGYLGNIGTGLLAGWNAARRLRGEAALTLPKTTMLGSLCDYVSNAGQASFQPMKANFGLLPPLEQGGGKRAERARAHAERSQAAMEAVLGASRGIAHSHYDAVNSD